MTSQAHEFTLALVAKAERHIRARAFPEALKALQDATRNVAAHLEELLAFDPVQPFDAIEDDLGDPEEWIELVSEPGEGLVVGQETVVPVAEGDEEPVDLEVRCVACQERRLGETEFIIHLLVPA